MTTETLSSPALDLSDAVGKLRSDLENVQRELDQALGVWRTALHSEKKEFESQLRALEASWSVREKAWQHQRQDYERKIQELDAAFQTQLEASEQNALRALNELDDAWQRDKLAWSHHTDRRIKELEIQENQLRSEREKLLQTIEQQGSRISHLDAALRQQEQRAADAELKAALAEAQKSPAAAPDESVRHYVDALEKEIALLNDLISHFSSTSSFSIPSRRKTDLLPMGDQNRVIR